MSENKMQKVNLDDKISEAEYYKKLFIENPQWNKPIPNDEEKIRWDIIEKFMMHVKHFTNDREKSKINILDVGCGRGWLSNLLSDYGTVTGIEPVKEVADFAKTLFPRINIKTGTTKDLLADNEFENYDIIICSEVIEHIPDNLKNYFISDMKVLLKTKGFLIITTPRKEAQIEWMKFTSPNQPVEDWLDEKTLKELFTSANFDAHLTERYSVQPTELAPLIEVYQLWLFQKN